MTRPKDDSELTQFSHWIRSDLVEAVRAKALRERRRQKLLIEEALTDLLAKPEPPAPSG